MKAEVTGPDEPQAAAASVVPLALKLQLSVRGRELAQLVHIKAATRAAWVHFPGYENFSFPFVADDALKPYPVLPNPNHAPDRQTPGFATR